MKQWIAAVTMSLTLLLLGEGCTKEIPDQPIANKQPKTFLWLFPDTSLAEGHSRQHLRWWGEDPDGIIVGYLFASGRFTASQLRTPALDTLAWRWRTVNDTVMAFPLLTKRDTFEVVVRAVDNSSGLKLPDDALVRFAPAGTAPGLYPGAPFWDKNADGQLDAADMLLSGLSGAMDPAGATLGMPVLNQPPSVVFAQDPNDPTRIMQQPDTTFTAATFSWVGSDPDGDQTIASYDIALNDSLDPAGILTLPGNTKLVSLVVPRSVSDQITGVQPVAADVWTGTFQTTRRKIGSLPNLKLDTLNVFYVRARDVAGDVSRFIRMPGDPAKKWFVKNPRGKLLIVNDYISGDRATVLNFYKTIFADPRIGMAQSEMLDIGRGLTAQQKRESKIGAMVPPFIDPAFMYTLQLFDIVFWYTDGTPSLAVAQSPLFQYVRDPSHRGKVIFTTMFETSSDPRGAITDFSPLDSISSVSLVNSRLLPTMGDTRLPKGFEVVPDSSDPADVYPPLVFGNVDAGGLLDQPVYSVFLRSIYQRSDARYIYHIQPDSRSPLRYSYLPTLNDLRGLSSTGTSGWTCGAGGTVLHTSDGGQTWLTQATGSASALRCIRFPDPNTGWVVGDSGVILRTTNGGTTWSDRSVTTTQNLLSTWFTSDSSGVIVGTNGLFIRTADQGRNWISIASLHTTNTLRDVRFVDAQTGLVVGDGGFIARTTDGGATWHSVTGPTVQRLSSVAYASSSLVFAAGAGSTLLRSSDGGENWAQVSLGGLAAVDFDGVFADNQNAWACGTGGTVIQSLDGGGSWTPGVTGVGQTITEISFSTPAQGIAVATGGVILTTADGGLSWSLEPRGNMNVGVIDGVGLDGYRSFLFLGLPLHMLDGPGSAGGTVIPFLQHVIHNEFGG